MRSFATSNKKDEETAEEPAPVKKRRGRPPKNATAAPPKIEETSEEAAPEIEVKKTAKRVRKPEKTIASAEMMYVMKFNSPILPVIGFSVNQRIGFGFGND